jgi:hypothetical protein
MRIRRRCYSIVKKSEDRVFGGILISVMLKLYFKSHKSYGGFRISSCFNILMKFCFIPALPHPCTAALFSNFWSAPVSILLTKELFNSHQIKYSPLFLFIP